jgi:hypothetical protein
MPVSHFGNRHGWKKVHLVDGEVLYFHRMKDATDHSDAKDIARVLGITPAEGRDLEAAVCGTDSCERS